MMKKYYIVASMLLALLGCSYTRSMAYENGSTLVEEFSSSEQHDSEIWLIFGPEDEDLVELPAPEPVNPKENPAVEPGLDDPGAGETPAVPEPSTFLLLALGLLAFAGLRRRRKQNV